MYFKQQEGFERTSAELISAEVLNILFGSLIGKAAT
jgi:hypothetical protein